MSIDMTTKIIQLILAPVVMVSACAILTGGILSHYGAINDRLRALTHERLQLLRGPHGALASREQVMSLDAYSRERLTEIDTQTPQLLARHGLVHHGILATYLAILGFIGSMFVIALAAISSSPVVASVAVCVFLASTAILLIGIAQVARDIRLSQISVEYEAQRVGVLGAPDIQGIGEQSERSRAQG
ncbi:MAG TPA: DUF2721 domain-containing protein [Ktedonobacterales bacterium]